MGLEIQALVKADLLWPFLCSYLTSSFSVSFLRSLNSRPRELLLYAEWSQRHLSPLRSHPKNDGFLLAVLAPRNIAEFSLGFSKSRINIVDFASLNRELTVLIFMNVSHKEYESLKVLKQKPKFFCSLKNIGNI